jgi:hypothetical protein
MTGMVLRCMQDDIGVILRFKSQQPRRLFMIALRYGNQMRGHEKVEAETHMHFFTYNLKISSGNYLRPLRNPAPLHA